MEKKIIHVKQARRAYPFTYLFAGLLIAASGFAFSYSFPYFYAPAAVGGLIALYNEINVYRHTLQITKHKVTARHGILSRQAYSIYYEDIMNMRVSQNLWERLWSYGSIYINNPTKAENDFYVHKMPSPRKLQKLIESREHEFAVTRHKKKTHEIVH